MEKATAVRLPVTDQDGYYEIRLESIGGLGANLCGSMLGELGSSELGLNSTSFSSYGSEKTGTPVKAYIRYCEKEKEIRVHSPGRTRIYWVSFMRHFFPIPLSLKVVCRIRISSSIRSIPRRRSLR